MDFDKAINDMFGNLDQVFDGYELKMAHGKWISPYHVNGTRDRQGKRQQLAIQPSGAVSDFNGDTTDVVNLFRTFHPEFGDRVTAIREMIKRAGLDVNEYDDSTPEQQQRRTDRERLAEQLRADYLGTPGDPVRRYLATGRGWTPADIDAAADFLAVVTDATRPEFERVTGLMFGNGDGANATPSTTWHRDTIVIPTYDRQRRVRYAKTRSIVEKRFGNPNATLSHVDFAAVPMFNYNRTAFAADIAERRRVVVVESELCAIRCTVRGISNVVALRGSAVTRENVVNMVVDGAQQIVLALDADKKPAEIRRTVERFVTYSDNLLSVFVATWPAELGKDPDEIITRHGEQPVRDAVDNAVKFDRWNAATYAAEFNQATTDSDRQAVRDAALEQLSALEPLARKEFADTYSATTGDAFDAADLIDSATARQQAREQLAFADKLKKANDGLSRAIATGDPVRVGRAFDAMTAIERPRPDADPLALEHEFDDLTTGQMFAELADNGDDIVTPFYFYGDRHAFPLRLKSTGVTYICANTSHGKSVFLQNLAYWLAYGTTGRPVLFYSLEEAKNDVITEFANIHIHNADKTSPDRYTEHAMLTHDRTKTNLSVLRDYFRTGNADVFDALANVPDQYNDRLTERQKIGRELGLFVRDLRGADGHPRRLYVVDRQRDPNEQPRLELSRLPDLLRHIDAMVAKIHPAAIFIDYVQLITSGERYLNTFDDLAHVVSEIQAAAQRLRIPIVCAAQMNRDNGKSDIYNISIDNISGSSAIEKGADAIVLLVNSMKFRPRSKEEKERPIDWPVGPVVMPGQPGYLLAALVKNRGGVGYAHALFKYDGARRWIPSGEYSADTREPEPDADAAPAATTPAVTLPCDDDNNDLFTQN